MPLEVCVLSVPCHEGGALVEEKETRTGSSLVATREILRLYQESVSFALTSLTLILSLT